MNARRAALVLLLQACVSFAWANQEELKETRARIEALKKEIAQAEGVRVEAADALKESEVAVSTANRQLAQLSQEQRAAQQALAQLGRDSRGTQSQIDKQRAALAKLVRERYVAYGGEFAQSPLKLFFSGENPARGARELAYLGYAARAQTKLIETMRGNVQRLASLTEEARVKAMELATIEASQKAERAELVKQQAQSATVLASIAGHLQAQRREVKTLEANEKRLSSLIEKLAKLAEERRAKASTRATRPTRQARAGTEPEPRTSSTAPVQPVQPSGPGLRNDELPSDDLDDSLFAKLKGRLRLPAKGELVGRFGSPRAEGPSWKGVFIKADAGAEVRSVAQGRVVFADWMRGFGNLLIVDHGGQYLSVYGNNESLLKQVGDAVTAGDMLAKVGASGGQAESGLYFELRHQGKPFDPLSWVKR